MHRGHLGCCGDCERAWRRRGKPSRDGDADLCPCDSAADRRLRMRHWLRCERPISPGRPQSLSTSRAIACFVMRVIISLTRRMKVVPTSTVSILLYSWPQTGSMRPSQKAHQVSWLQGMQVCLLCESGRGGGRFSRDDCAVCVCVCVSSSPARAGPAMKRLFTRRPFKNGYGTPCNV